jgi:RNA polymerase sigma-70 factor (ECF subfamily)
MTPRGKISLLSRHTTFGATLILTGKPLSECSDAELLAGGQRGDQRAFAALVQRHGRFLFGVARRMLSSPEDAEDVVQEALLAALRARFEGRSAVRTWLVAIVLRQASLARRKQGRRTMHYRAVTEESVESDRSQRSAEPAVDARLDVETLLGQLPEEHREIIVLRELNGMSYDEMSQALGIPMGTVESRLHRARGALRELMQARGIAPGARR